MSKLFALVLCVMGLHCATYPPPALPSHEVVAQDLAALTVALVEVEEDDPPRVYCSGVWLGETDIVTAGHCTRGESDFTYQTKGDSNVYKAALGYLDEAHDLAVLHVTEMPPHSYAILGGLPAIGSRALTMGHPLGVTWSFSSGDVSGIRERRGPLEMPITWIQATAPISPGNSGCGLWSEDGRLLGIASHVMQTRQGLAQSVNFFVPVMYLH